jgi:hypothetical protein
VIITRIIYLLSRDGPDGLGSLDARLISPPKPPAAGGLGYRNAKASRPPVVT